MKTNDLIDMLSQDSQMDAAPHPAFDGMLGALILVILAFIAAQFGYAALRPDYLIALQNPLVVSKQVLPFLLAIILLLQMRKTTSPEAKLNVMWWAIAGFIAIMILLFVFSLIQTPNDAKGMAIAGKSNTRCMVLIPVFSLPVCFALLHALRRGAPANPTSSGFIAGILAGSIACVIYAFGCTEDNPTFFALWYSLAIFVSGVFGALIGRTSLKW